MDLEFGFRTINYVTKRAIWINFFNPYSNIIVMCTIMKERTVILINKEKIHFNLFNLFGIPIQWSLVSCYFNFLVCNFIIYRQCLFNDIQNFNYCFIFYSSIEMKVKKSIVIYFYINTIFSLQ